MKRMKKLYSITEQTIAIIQKLAQEQCITESYALDNMALNYYRMTHKNQNVPTIATIKTKESKQEKKEKLKKEINLIDDILKDKTISPLQRREAEIEKEIKIIEYEKL